MGKRRKRKQKQQKGKWLKFGLVLIFFTVFLALGEQLRREKTKAFSEAASEVFQDGTGLEIHYLDVGQGDSTLILCDGHAMHIDAGDNGKRTVVAYSDGVRVTFNMSPDESWKAGESRN